MIRINEFVKSIDDATTELGQAEWFMRDFVQAMWPLIAKHQQRMEASTKLHAQRDFTIIENGE